MGHIVNECLLRFFRSCLHSDVEAGLEWLRGWTQRLGTCQFLNYFQFISLTQVPCTEGRSNGNWPKIQTIINSKLPMNHLLIYFVTSFLVDAWQTTNFFGEYLELSSLVRISWVGREMRFDVLRPRFFFIRSRYGAWRKHSSRPCPTKAAQSKTPSVILSCYDLFSTATVRLLRNSNYWTACEK